MLFGKNQTLSFSEEFKLEMYKAYIKSVFEEQYYKILVKGNDNGKAIIENKIPVLIVTGKGS